MPGEILIRRQSPNEAHLASMSAFALQLPAHANPISFPASVAKSAAVVDLRIHLIKGWLVQPRRKSGVSRLPSGIADFSVDPRLNGWGYATKPLRSASHKMDSDPDESELIRRLADGDESAVADLYDRFARPLYSMVHRILHNPADAEEIVQDVFVSLWKNADTFDARRSSPFTWLVTIARNKSIDRLRRTQRRLPEAPGSAEPNPALEPIDESRDAAATTAGNERAEIVSQWVAELPENQREAVGLAFFDGLTHPQIAERLHESVGTVKSRIRLGIEKLRRKTGGEITK